MEIIKQLTSAFETEMAKLSQIVIDRTQHEGFVASLKSEVARLLDEKTDLISGIQSAQETHAQITSGHDKDIEDKKMMIATLDRDILDKTNKSAGLDGTNASLSAEKRSLLNEIDQLRVAIATLTRSKSELDVQMNPLSDKVGSSLKELSDIQSKIDAAKKEYAQVSSDLAILKSRQ